MLASASTISVVADALKRHGIRRCVVDPVGQILIAFATGSINHSKVMVATTGAVLLPESAVKTLCKDLLPKTYLLTPNIPEANLILREAGRKAIDVKDLDDLKKLAAVLQTLGPAYVLVKGGHLPLTSDYKVAKSEKDKKIVVNVLWGNDVVEVIETPYQKSKNTHGTGDSLACTYISLNY